MRNSCTRDEVQKAAGEMSIVEIEKAIEELKTEVRGGKTTASRDYAPEVKSIIDAFESIRTELLLDLPNVDTLFGLLAHARSLSRVDSAEND